VSGADGIGDTEGKAATGSGERAGRQASFKFVPQILWRTADYPPLLWSSRLREKATAWQTRIDAINVCYEF
jgi:hypothetical protein